MPLIVYDIPYRTGVTLGWRTLRSLAEIPGIIGVKHAVGGIDADTVRFMSNLLAGFAVLSGEDEFVSPLLAFGATGGILAAVAALPEPAARTLPVNDHPAERRANRVQPRTRPG